MSPPPLFLRRLPRTLKPPVAGGVLLAATLALAWACTDAVAPRTVRPTEPSRPLADVSGQTCGVGFTAVVTNEDALLASYGVPATTDTVQVCETWVGNDYVMRETTVGRAPNGFRDPDTARTVVYSGGQVSGVAADGGPAHDAVEVGTTAFDFMQVDDATRQASYDDPYYAVYSGGGCANPTEIICSSGPAYSRAPSGTATSSSAAAADTTRDKFQKHGLKRRGVRALVDGAEEVGRSAKGDRRFRKQRGDAEVTFTLDKGTELLVGEETTNPNGTTKATHTWKQHKRGGYVREQSVVESVERIRGREVRSRTTTTILDLDTAGPSSVPVRPTSPSRAPR